VLLFLFLSLLMRAGNSAVYASFDSPLYESIYAQLEELELDEVLRYVEILESEYREFVPTLRFQDIITANSSGRSGRELLALMGRTLLKEVYFSSHLTSATGVSCCSLGLSSPFRNVFLVKKRWWSWPLVCVSWF